MLLHWHSSVCVILTIVLYSLATNTNLPPSFTHDMNNLALSENTPVGKVVFTLEGSDPENSSIQFGLRGIDLLEVNPNTGEVTVVKALDHEVNDTLNFFVTIEDEVQNAPIGGNNIVEVPVTVIVLDENDNAPTFQNVPYVVFIEEDTPINTTVYSDIQVTDADTVGDAIEVECVNLPNFNNACDIFDIKTINSAQSSYHGGLILKQKLDFRLKNEHQFLLKATDGKLNSTTTVYIKVGDVQDTPPEFIGSLHAEIREDAPINTLVLTVHAEDGDRGMPRKIVYELIKNPMNYFLIDAVSGEIRTARPLDKEAIDNPLGILSLIVKAREIINGTKGNDALTVTNAEVTVVIKDVNDEPPMFNKNEYHVEISEDINSGDALPNLNMTVTDPDVGNNSVFSLMLDDILHSFSIEPEVVEGSSPVTIRITNSSLDYEDPNQRKFIILVIAREIYTNPQLSSTATITVTVTDANDNAPTFDMQSYSAIISEMATPGTLVQTIIAKDRDSGKFGENGIIYQLFGNDSEKFIVNNRTGVITVGECNNLGSMECLDYETKHEYFLSFKATDDDGNGQSTIVPFTIKLTDSNDNPPKFSKPVHNVFVNEGTVKFEPDLIIMAEDLDKTSHITYSIIAGNTNDIFNIDPNTGKMRIASNKVISFSNDTKNNNIILNVEATDGKYTASTVVNVTIIDINDHNPVFEKESYSSSVPEDTKIGSSIFELKATDDDTGINAEIKYQIKKGAFNDFTIDSESGVITVLSKLDYDRRDTYNIEVAAVDQGAISLTGTTTVTVRIINTNDKPPYFIPIIQKAEVMKDAKIGTVVHTLIAIDPDINPLEALNFEAVEPITATDKYGKVVENILFKDFFAVDKTTGKVFVINQLQRDIAAVIKITVIVTDTTAPMLQQGEGTLIITIMDINDNPPRFLPPWTPESPRYTLQIEEELPVGTIVATYTATDEDSVIAGYYIKPESKYFEINNGTGILQIKERIDYEKTNTLNFTVVAYDSGIPQLNASAIIYVTVLNINDNIPTFSQKIYNTTINENSPNGSHVITVTATDQDAEEYGRISYSLIGEHNENFIISPQSGEIFVANPLFLDREVFNETTIQVVASDNAPGNLKHSISVPVYISILDVNDNAPEFNQSSYNATISENIRFNPPFLILQVVATDADEGINGNINYKIISGNQDDIFLLGEDTGILYAHKSLLGKTYDFILEIEARDEAGKGKFSDKCMIYIHVVNVNEHKPTFIVPASPNTTVEVTENAVQDYLIMTIKAIDKDYGENGRITYHFKINETNLQETTEFIINENTGELKTKLYLNRNIKPKYELILVARDHGLPIWYETMHYLTILLVDSNDNEAKFPISKKTNPYHFYITENAERNTLIGQVRAFDAKQDKTAKVYYYLLSGTEDGAFSINKLDGSLYSNKVFDREEADEYDLLVLANNEPDFYLTAKEQNRILNNETVHGSSIAKIKVTIKDLNDNPPKFNKPAYYAAVNSMAYANSFVANLTATDPDFGINGSIIYYIKSSSLYKYGSNKSSGSVIPSPFNITEDGQLFTATSLTENNQHRFIVDIIAREVAYPEREGLTKIYIWIFESEQLIRVILSRPAEEVMQEKDEIISELSNATNYLIICDEIKDHVDKNGRQIKEWSDMYILAVDPSTQTIGSVYDILKIIDAKYDYLKDYYAGFAIENVVPAFAVEPEESFDPALSALIALLLVLLVGIITFIIVCCCLRNWMISPSNLKKKDALINKAIIDELNTTENPLWIEQKLKIYEEQELTMQVFNEPEQAMLDRRNSAEFVPDDNTYATIQHPNRRGSSHTATLSLVDDIADYATLSRLPHNSDSSHSSIKDAVNYYEAAMGFQGSTFQVPDSSGGNISSPDDYISQHHGSELTLNNDGQLEYVAELI